MLKYENLDIRWGIYCMPAKEVFLGTVRQLVPTICIDDAYAASKTNDVQHMRQCVQTAVRYVAIQDDPKISHQVTSAGGLNVNSFSPPPQTFPPRSPARLGS